MNTTSLSQSLLSQVGINPKAEVKLNRSPRSVRVTIPQPLTQKQVDVLNFVKDFIDTNKYPPTRQEIASYMGYKSANAAEEHIKALEKKGVIAIAPKISRGIRIL